MNHDSNYAIHATSYNSGDSQYIADGESANAMYASGRPDQGRMGPPPLPIDPVLESWPRSTGLPSSSVTSSQLSQSIALHDRSLSTSRTLNAISRDILVPPSKPSDLESNPLLRFWNEVGPWNSQRIGTGADQSQSAQQYATAHERITSTVPFGSYRDSARSDSGSQVARGRPSDSGYETRSYVTKSVLSTDPLDQSHETQSLIGEVDGMQLQSQNNSQDYFHEESQEDQSLIYTAWDQSTQETHTLTCDSRDCNFISRNISEHRKHLQRHSKHFKCSQADCTRSEGFSTKNDLDRHKKSVHRILSKNPTDRSFQCAASNCSKKDKVWPRQDNFRSHCLRMHPKEDVNELIRKSEMDPHQVSIVNIAGGGLSLGLRGEGTNQLHVENDSIDGLNAQSLQKDLIHRHMPEVPNGSIAVHNKMASENDVGSKFGLTNPARQVSPHIRMSGAEGLQYSAVEMPAPHVDNDLRNVRLKSVPSSTNTDGPANMEHRNFKQISSQCKGIRTSRAPTSRGPLCQPGKNTVSDPSIDNAKATQLSKAIASDVTNCVNLGQASLEELQLIIKTRVLSIFDPTGARNTHKRTILDAKLDETMQAKTKRVACKSCPKMMERPCDLKKHEKRHSRPYGCTHTGCNKKFGSKNDWKRHENSQHYQIETWRCHEFSHESKIKQCAKIFFRSDPFQIHLRKDHNIQSDEYIREQGKRGRIAPNGQSGFWCGFCKKIVILVTRGLEAWDERFNHIDDEHFKKGQTIEEWYPLDQDIPKGLLKNENILDSGGLPTNADDEYSSSEDDESCNHRSRPPPPPPPPPPRSLSKPNPRNYGKVKPAYPSEHSRQKASLPRYVYCCNCGFGPYTPAHDTSCCGDGCNHRLCASCRVESVPQLESY